MILKKVFGTIVLSASLLGNAIAQSTTVYTDPLTGITGTYWQPGTAANGRPEHKDFSLGIAIPSDQTTYPEEFILQITGPRSASSGGGGWAGISIGGGMVQGLLFAVYMAGSDTSVSATLRITPSYSVPKVYTGPATLTKLSQKINSTHYQGTFRCQKCMVWNQDGVSGDIRNDVATGSGVWGYAFASSPIPADPTQLPQHDLGFGNFGVNYQATRARGGNYGEWIKLGQTATTTSRQVTTTTRAATTTTAVMSPSPAAVYSSEYDYIIVGSGPGGQVMADKLSESGKFSVLLVERGPPSTWVHGGRDGPAWATDNQLTRFDVPAMVNSIYVNQSYLLCPDYSDKAGCVLGGGTAVNAGLFWRPPKNDFDNSFPDGWKSSDMATAVSNVFEKIPSTVRPNADAKDYLSEAYDLLTPVLSANGYTAVNGNETPDLKNMTYTRVPFMYINGERGGPLATYMVNARKRSNFNILFNSMVQRVSRTGSTVTGVEVEGATGGGGFTGIIKLKAKGRVVISAGTFGSPKLLWRSGIGSTDMLNIVSAAEGGKMISSSQWINLPVGYNLMDHTNTDLTFSHSSIKSYDYNAALSNPNATDKALYLQTPRSGILATGAPGFPLAMHEIVMGTDGKPRSFQWLASPRFGTSVTLSLYLGNGYTTRGRLIINSQLNTQVQVSPYGTTGADVQAVVDSVTRMYGILSQVNGLRWSRPAAGQTAAQLDTFVRGLGATGRGTNHWMGSCKMGTNDGRNNAGTSGDVVDLNTKVYGTDNLFVVDASIFPGMSTGNPTAMILAVAERAAQRILALAGGPDGTTPTTSVSPSPKITTSVSPSPKITTSVSPSPKITTSVSPSPRTTTSVSPSPKTSPLVSPSPSPATCVANLLQCGGSTYTGNKNCCSGVCQFRSSFYSQCVAATTTSPSPAVSPKTSPATSPSPSPSACVVKYGQCGGQTYTGITTCCAGSTCTVSNDFYSQCR